MNNCVGQVSKTSQEGAKSVYIGAGVYPTLALFNHSCDPCIVRYYVEDYVVVQAIKNIRKVRSTHLVPAAE